MHQKQEQGTTSIGPRMLTLRLRRTGLVMNRITGRDHTTVGLFVT